MEKQLSLRTLALAGMLVLASATFAQKKPLDASAYDSWKSVSGSQLTDDGKWLSYRITPQEGDSVAEIKSTDGSKVYKIDRASVVSFSQDGKFAVATVVPPFAELKEARRKKTKPEDMPKNALVIVNLASGELTKLENVTSFTIAEIGRAHV